MLGQIPEAIYFALFMIYTKQLKEKRMLFITLMIAEYLLLKHFIAFNVWFQVLYTFMTFLLLKVLYKEKAQVTDIFTFTIASIILITSSASMYGIAYITYKDLVICTILNRILIFALVFIFKDKLNKIQKMYKKFWNRNDKNKNRIKATTFRSINIVIFNIVFYIINIGMLFIILEIGGV